MEIWLIRRSSMYPISLYINNLGTRFVLSEVVTLPCWKYSHRLA